MGWAVALRVFPPTPLWLTAGVAGWPGSHFHSDYPPPWESSSRPGRSQWAARSDLRAQSACRWRALLPHPKRSPRLGRRARCSRCIHGLSSLGTRPAGMWMAQPALTFHPRVKVGGGECFVHPRVHGGEGGSGRVCEHRGRDGSRDASQRDLSPRACVVAHRMVCASVVTSRCGVLFCEEKLST